MYMIRRPSGGETALHGFVQRIEVPAGQAIVAAVINDLLCDHSDSRVSIVTNAVISLVLFAYLFTEGFEDRAHAFRRCCQQERYIRLLLPEQVHCPVYLRGNGRCT